VLRRQRRATVAKSEVGFGRPPKHSRFRPGTSGNRRGRPKRKATALAEIANEVLNTSVEYREGGRRKKATRHELTLMALVKQALGGSVAAAEMLLKIRARSQKDGGGVQIIELNNWLPDYPGQTGEEKSRQHMNEADLDSSGGRDHRAEIRPAKNRKRADSSSSGAKE
jgi:hypothetical protein